MLMHYETTHHCKPAKGRLLPLKMTITGFNVFNKFPQTLDEPRKRCKYNLQYFHTSKVDVR